MATYSGAWDRAEAAAFLEDAVVPLRLACHTLAGDLWMLSLWFRFQDGQFECATGAGADVVGFLRENPAVAFEVSTNEPPYRGVRGRGTAAIAPDEDKAVLRALIDRYLAGPEEPPAPALLSKDREEVRITIDPERIYSWDFTDRMSGGN